MKRIPLVLSLVLFVSATFAQKIAYIETEKLVTSMEEFRQANEEIDAAIEEWNRQIDAKFQKIDSLYQAYVLNESKLTDMEKKARQEEIFSLEEQARQFREEIYGTGGKLARLQEEKIGPLYEQVREKAAEIARENGYDYVFDKIPGGNWIYTNPDHDLTGRLAEALGITLESTE